MWTKFSHRIIRYRIVLVALIGVITVFMGYHARKIEMSYDLATVVPPDDPDMIKLQEFRSLFGEDGNILAIAVKDSTVFEQENFRRFKYMTEEINKIKGVKQVISLPNLVRLKKNTVEKKFEAEPIFTDIPEDQDLLDSMLQVAFDQKFYSGQLINEQNGAILTLVTIDKDVLNSAKRIQLTQDIQQVGQLFEEHTGITLRYAGLPFVRSVVAGKVKNEMLMFILLSVGITGLIMLIFFRSWSAVIFPISIIAVVVVWVIGSLVLLGFKITLLTGVIPSIIVIIGIPNSIYLLNKYHQEFGAHGNKIWAISRVTRKIGFVTLITNLTTAIGFLVLGFTDIVVLKEFGLVAGLNIMATFLVSIILLPAVFYWMPSPKKRHLKHLRLKPVDKVLTVIDLLVHRHKYRVFVVTISLVVISVIGILQVQTLAFMVDDIPEDSQIKKDLKFLEENFSGVMPLELVVDTGKKRGVTQIATLQKVNELEEYLGSHRDISRPVSIVSFVKASRQAYYSNKPVYYDLPTRQERAFILRYLRSAGDNSNLMNSFVDTTGQKLRISLKVADIGSIKMDSLIHTVIEPEMNEILDESGITASITGTTPIFIKGNKFLVENLQVSFILAFVIISIIMALLFANLRMIIISLIPNIIPLMMTGAIMGFFGIPLKPSTAIVFSIAFGISVDYSIHFLAKYRQELFANNFFVPLGVSKSIREIGSSMMYTSVVLYAGFIIFAASDFGGTVALGILTSTTLLIAMITNLVVLPSLLLAFDTGKRRENVHPLIEHYDEFYVEEEDEEIDIQRIRVETRS